jgi:hypothetical protein
MLALFLAAGIAQAGTGDITKRDQGGGAVELSNLGTDEDAQVVVAAPARAAVEPVARPVPAAVARPAPEVAAIERQAKPAADGKSKREKSEEELADERNGEGRGDYAGAAAAGREGYANYGGGLGSYGYGYGAGGASTGVVDSGPGSSGNNGATSGTGGSSGGTGSTPVATSPATGSTGGGTSYGNSNTAGAGSAPTAGLSPDQMALRVAQYRDAMLNEQRGANGLVANPAVQRRYLMINRAGYMGLGY